jgi:Rrf2 family protein
MEISRQADYAVRAVCELALQGEGERVRSEDIAARQTIPQPFLIKIFARLAAEGIVDTQRGVGGGVRLIRSPQELTLLDVVEAVEGPITLNRCVRRPGECPLDATCVVHPIWMDLRDEIRRRLASITFDVLVQRAKAFPKSKEVTEPWRR